MTTQKNEAVFALRARDDPAGGVEDARADEVQLLSAIETLTGQVLPRSEEPDFIPDHRVPHLAFQPDELSDVAVLPMAQVVTSYYLRLRVADQAGVLAQVTGILAQAGISIDAVLQREAGEGENQTDLIILTHDCVEQKMNEAIAQMQALTTVLNPITRIRKEELN